MQRFRSLVFLTSKSSFGYHHPNRIVATRHAWRLAKKALP
jgi:hypothetical protein